MKKIVITAVCLLSLISYKTSAQDQTPNYVIEEKVKPGVEKYGNTLNLGAGIGCYTDIGILTPAAMLNYEFDIFRDFTLAPFVGVSSFQDSYYWGNPNFPNTDPSYRYYNYQETVIPVGIKGTYYFDEWLRVNPKWDLYLATSVGFVFKTVVWENGYYGNTGAYQAVNPLYVAMHIGGEYHLGRKAGLFLDLSTAISTFGVAIHF